MSCFGRGFHEFGVVVLRGCRIECAGRVAVWGATEEAREFLVFVAEEFDESSV